MARDAARERVGGTEPAGDERSSSAAPCRMPCDASASATADAAQRLGHPGQRRHLLADLLTVLSSGRRSSAMWIAVAIWFAERAERR